MLFTVEGCRMKNIFQKYSLKYVFCVVIIFKMDHTYPPDGVSVLIDRPAGIFLAAHNSFPVSYYLCPYLCPA